MTKPQAMHPDSVEVVSIRTVPQKNDPSTGLSFFEAENDLPFPIGRIEVYYESAEASLRGFDHAREGSALLFCPSGAVAVLADTGSERRRIVLDRPSVGLILSSAVWREISWLEPGSVLCAAVSERCSAALSDDYEAFGRAAEERREERTQ